MLVTLNCSITVWRSRRPIASRSSGLVARIRSSARAKPAVSPTRTRGRPLAARAISRCGGMSEAITGTPQAIASSIATGRPSPADVVMNTSAFASSRYTSSRGTIPRSCTDCSRCSCWMRSLSCIRSSPSPMNVSLSSRLRMARNADSAVCGCLIGMSRLTAVTWKPGAR